jgi:site-specific recombinase XerD
VTRELALPERTVGGGGELLEAFEQQVLAIAASAASPNTRRAYATAYRAFAGFLHARYGGASIETFTLAAVAAWRDHLQAAGLAPSSVAQRVSAVRRLAAAIDADPLVARVRCTQVQQDRPSALSGLELSQLLTRPDLRTTIGIRDRAILELLARAGLRRSELARLTLADIQERGRQPDVRRRVAVAPRRGDQTPLEVVVRGSKRGRTRTVPLHAEAHDALRRWYVAPPRPRRRHCSSACAPAAQRSPSRCRPARSVTSSSSTPPAAASGRIAAPRTRSDTRSARCSPNAASPWG